MNNPRDILASRPMVFLIYGLPTLAIFVSGVPAVTNGARTLIWALACAVMGAGCLANAIRCGRVHCYFTGPYFLALAGLVVLYGTGVAPLGPSGWNLIGAALLAGAVLLMWAPERLFGKYRQILGR
ncbi:MAG: hypothetical protein ACREEB_07890 [Caulobacteraceae bacterium]